MLMGCNSVFAKTLYHYVVVGPDNQQIVRVIVDNQTCPTLFSNTNSFPMTLRAAADSTSQSKPNHAFFPVTVCELSWPADTPSLRLEGETLPHLPQKINNVAVIGDTGCRIKAPFAYQACNESKQWPLKEVSHAIINNKPDVLIHVGDYLYRESRCVTPGCQGSVHGYGWDSWQADVFQPMQELMAKVPLVLVRGNHESCHRAGEGWFRFFDPYPYDSQRACINPVETVIDQPYSVMMNSTTQWIIFDSAEVQELHPDKHINEFIDKMDYVRHLLKPGSHHWLLLHHPSLGYFYSHVLGWNGGTSEIYNAMVKGSQESSLLKQFDLLLQGHIHTFEMSNYADTTLPISIVSGMGGTELEDRFPHKNLMGYEVETGIKINKEVNEQRFGYLMYTEKNNMSEFVVYDASGLIQQSCQVSLTTKDFVCKRGFFK